MRALKEKYMTLEPNIIKEKVSALNKEEGSEERAIKVANNLLKMGLTVE